MCAAMFIVFYTGEAVTADNEIFIIETQFADLFFPMILYTDMAE